MADIRVRIEESVYVSPEEWLETSDRQDIEIMESLILEKKYGRLTIQQQELLDKFTELMNRYYTLPQSTIDTIMKL